MRRFFYKKTLSLCLILLFLIPVFLFGCKKEKKLSDYITDLRIDEYYGNSGDLELKGVYGYSTVNGEKVYALTFKLLNSETDEAKRELSFCLGEKKYESILSFNPISSCKTTTVEITEVPNKEFSVTVKTASDSVNIILESVIPNETLTYQSALNRLEEQQSQLITHYKDENGNFTGKIEMRVFKKNDKTYWYVCLTDINGLNKAMLVSGENGEVLAIRNII